MKFLATPVLIAAIATSTGIVVRSLGSNIDGTKYSFPNSRSTPLYALFTTSGTGYYASFARLFAHAIFISLLKCDALVSKAPLNKNGKTIALNI